MKRTIAAALLYILLIGLLVLLVVFLGPPLYSELQGTLVRAPEMLGQLSHKINEWAPGINLTDPATMNQVTSGITKYVIALPMTIGTALITGALVFFLSFYWLVSIPSIHSSIRSLFPRHLHGEVNSVIKDVSRAMGGYLRGVAINAVVTGFLAWIGLHFAGIDYAFALGVLTAMGEFIPVLGPVLAAVPAVLVALLQSPAKALLALIIYVGVQQIEGHLLTPNIMRSQTNVPQVLVIAAIFAGGAIGGVLGAIVAVPVAGAGMALSSRLVAPAIRRWTSRQFGTRHPASAG